MSRPQSINLTYNHTAPTAGWPPVDTAAGRVTPQLLILTVTANHHATAALAFVTVRGTDEAGDTVVATLHTTPTMPDFVTALVDQALTGAGHLWAHHTNPVKETAA